MESWSIEEKAAQLVFPRWGSNLPPPVPAARDFHRVVDLLQQYPFGGLILFNGSLDHTPGQIRTLQQRARHPLLIATDMEAGLGQQVDGASLFPHAMAFSHGEGASEERVAVFARIAALEALASGINIALAPVADVHRNRQNPIISIRAFSSDPGTAARCCAQYVTTARETGVLTTAKHFPGHGGTTGDSHAELPAVRDDRELLETADLIPFRACISAGVDIIMPAHVAYTTLDPILRPATLSPRILRGLLRDELGFDGVVMSDSMMMEGVRAASSTPHADAIRAGVDIILDPADPIVATQEIVLAVREGRLAEETVDSSVRRVQRLRESLVIRHGPDIFTEFGSLFAGVDIGGHTHISMAEKIARDAIVSSGVGEELLRDLRDRGKKVRLFLAASSRSAGLVDPLRKLLRDIAPHVSIVDVGSDRGAHGASRLLDGSGDVSIATVVARPAAWHQYGLTAWQESVINRVLTEHRALLLVLGSKDLTDRFGARVPSLCTHSDMPPSQRAIVRYLFD